MMVRRAALLGVKLCLQLLLLRLQLIVCASAQYQRGQRDKLRCGSQA